MSILDIAQRPYGTEARAAAFLSAGWAALCAGIARFAARRRARRSATLLYELSDRELRDIGLTRSDVLRVARDTRNRTGPGRSTRSEG